MKNVWIFSENKTNTNTNEKGFSKDVAQKKYFKNSYWNSLSKLKAEILEQFPKTIILRNSCTKTTWGTPEIKFLWKHSLNMLLEKNSWKKKIPRGTLEYFF